MPSPLPNCLGRNASIHPPRYVACGESHTVPSKTYWCKTRNQKSQIINLGPRTISQSKCYLGLSSCPGRREPRSTDACIQTPSQRSRALLHNSTPGHMATPVHVHKTRLLHCVVSPSWCENPVMCRCPSPDPSSSIPATRPSRIFPPLIPFPALQTPATKARFPKTRTHPESGAQTQSHMSLWRGLTLNQGPKTGNTSPQDVDSP